MNKYRSILSLAAVMLVLFSSSSFMVGIHLCGGDVQNIALFAKADVCEMEKQLPPCHKQEPKPCCDDEVIIHEGESFKVTSTEISFVSNSAIEMVIPEVLISEVIPSSPVSNSHYCNYDPPLRADDLTVSLQVFLI